MIRESLASTELNNGNGHRAEPVEIWRARQFIRDNLESKVSLREVAQSVNISANYLSEKFKKVTGVKFVDYVAAARIERARELLVRADLRVSEIAFGVGFQSLSQFNRVFKRLVRQSPSEFRATQTRLDQKKVNLNGCFAPSNFPVKMRCQNTHYLTKLPANG